jgi:hypothetical protein
VTANTPQIERCRICGGKNLARVLALGEQYLTGVFPRSLDEQITRGPLELVKCEGEQACGAVQLLHRYDLREVYGTSYGYRSGLNQAMVAHLQRKVRELQGRVGALRAHDLVLDIGSNDGTLLGCYPEMVTRVGVDPIAVKFQEFYQPGIEIIPDFFSADVFRQRFGDRKARIITSIAMFYDLETPQSFVEQVASVLADDGIWHFEQSYLPAMLEATAYDTVCHEHLEYYCLKQIKWMMDRGGLKLIDVVLNDINGGSFAVTVAKADSPHPPNSAAIAGLLREEEKAGLDTPGPYAQFRERVWRHREDLLGLLTKLREKGATVLGYGASTKGNVILQFCGLNTSLLPCIAEVNPDKFGRFTPGTQIPIVSEAEAHALKPDYFLVMPWHFRHNLLQREAAFLQRGGKMIFPLPKIEVVG